MLKMKSCAILLCFILCAVQFIMAQSNADLKPHPQDCSKYLHCDETGRCIVMSCGKGTEFNPNIGTCDYPIINRRCTNRNHKENFGEFGCKKSA